MPETSEPYTLHLVFLLAILSNLVFYCSELPLLLLAEQKICSQYPQLLDHGKCSDPMVQDQLATFIGFKTAFDSIPPLLTSLWYGSLVTRLGHKIVIALACSGELLNLLWVVTIGFSSFQSDMRLGWFAAVFLFIGGGQFLLYGIFSLVVVRQMQMPVRAKSLAMLHSITLISSLVGAPLSGMLLQHSIGLPFLVIISLALMRYPIVWLLSETSCCGDSQEEEDTTVVAETQPILAPDGATTIAAPTDVGSAIMELAKSSILPYCFLCFLVKRIAFTSEVLMFQSTAEKFDLALEATSWVRVPIGSGAAITLLLLLPLLLQRLKGYYGNNAVVELVAVRINTAVLAIGFALFWLSSNAAALTVGLFLCGAGEGLAPSLQALASSAVGTDRYPDLFAAISVVDTTAKLFGGPIMAKTFSVRDQSGVSLGLCFLLSSILFAVLFALSWSSPLRQLNARPST